MDPRSELCWLMLMVPALKLSKSGQALVQYCDWHNPCSCTMVSEARDRMEKNKRAFAICFNLICSKNFSYRFFDSRFLYDFIKLLTPFWPIKIVKKQYHQQAHEKLVRQLPLAFPLLHIIPLIVSLSYDCTMSKEQTQKGFSITNTLFCMIFS